jgi:DNA-binding NarL/FixJ family response regulator
MRVAGVFGVRLAPPGVRLPVWESGGRSATIDLVSRRILIVDDHSGFRASARRMLEAGGFEVVGEAGDGAAAMSAVRELVPDLVLLDVQLPDVNGIDLAARLTDNGPVPAVILTSSRPSDQLGPDLITSGALGFIPKDELTASAIEGLMQ